MAPSSRFYALVPAFVLAVACGELPEDKLPEPEAHEVHEWLTHGRYGSWPSDRVALPGLNGTTRRVYLNDLAVHRRSPLGAAGVREMYDATTGELMGISMLIKTSDGPVPADNWFFYETFDLSQPESATAQHAAPGCVSCHSDSPDILMSRHEDLHQ